MGGIGSGCWYRWNKKETTESKKRIDIRWMKKNGYLSTKHSGILRWTLNGKPTGSIGYRVESSRMILTYRQRENGGEWVDIQQCIHFDHTECNYGGKRCWFLCPGCNRRVAVLYGDKYFLCRKCLNLTYSTQQESPPFRLTSKAQKIRERLGASLNTSDHIIEKPKGMHRKTFERLKNEAYQATRKAYRLMGTVW